MNFLNGQPEKWNNDYKSELQEYLVSVACDIYFFDEINSPYWNKMLLLPTPLANCKIISQPGCLNKVPYDLNPLPNCRLCLKFWVVTWEIINITLLQT